MLPLAGELDVRRRSPPTSASSTCSRPASRRCRCSATTAAGRSRARRSTSRCARPAARWPTCSIASRGRSRSSSPRGWASRRRSRPSPAGWPRYPDLRFKLDATPDWDDELIAGLVETGAVDSIDFKGAYKGTPVDVDTDPAFYRRIAETFPDAWLEDPDLEAEAAREALRPYEDRITWDAPIHSIDDILARRVLPKTVNLKPSRFGSLRALFDAYDFCDERGMGAYGGGQYELGVGRGQIQYLAALFHPDAPNDIAPAGYDALDPEPGLPASPLEPELDATGFRRRS